MNILYGGQFGPGTHHSDIHIASAFEAAGHRVTRVSRETFHREGRGLVRETRADLLMLGKPRRMSAECVRDAHAPHVCMWMGDAFRGLDVFLGQYGKVVDTLLVTNTGFHAQLKSAGFPAVCFWPLSAPPEYRPIEGVEEKCDCVFIGNRLPEEENDEDRERVLDALVAAGLSVKRYGAGRQNASEPVAQGEAACGALHTGRLVIGMQHMWDLPGAQSRRTWEALASGRCLLNRYVPGLERLFRDGTDQVFWRTDEGLGEIAGAALASPSFRAFIGQEARRTVEARHTFAHRIRTLMLYLERKHEHTPWEEVLW